MKEQTRERLFSAGSDGASGRGKAFILSPLPQPPVQDEKRTLLEAVRRCSGLDRVEVTGRIHHGTNRVYALLYSSGPELKQAALKITPVSDEKDLLRAAVRHKLLLVLNRTFPFVPRMLPLNNPEGKGGDDLPYRGIIFDGTRTLSLSEWISCRPFRQSAIHLINAGRRAGQLLQCLSRLDMHDACLEDRSASALIFFSTTGYELNRYFSFPEFRYPLEQNGDDGAAAFARGHLSFLEEERDAALERLAGIGGLLRSRSAGFIHGELSPSNFGFDAAGEVTVIFDFDSLRFGLPCQDIAWMLSSFCICHSEGAPTVLRRVGMLLGSLMTAFSLNGDDVELIDLFIRINYLEAAHRKLGDWRSGKDLRMGFLKEDILALKWLREHAFRVRDCLPPPCFCPGGES